MEKNKKNSFGHLEIKGESLENLSDTQSKIIMQEKTLDFMVFLLERVQGYCCTIYRTLDIISKNFTLNSVTNEY